MHAMLDHDALLLPNLAAILEPSSRADFREKASAILAHLTAVGNPRAMWSVIDSVDVLPALVDRLVGDDNLEVRSNAARAIRHVALHGTSSQLRSMVRRGCIRPLCSALHSDASQIVAAALEALETILRADAELGRSNGPPDGGVSLVDQAWQAGGASRIQALCFHEDSNVRERSNRLLGAFFARGGGEVAVSSAVGPDG
jgi:importin subunit alpha-6/7